LGSYGHLSADELDDVAAAWTTRRPVNDVVRADPTLLDADGQEA